MPIAHLSHAQSHWGIEQWLAYLKDKDIPVLPWTQAVLEVMAQEKAEEVAPRELVNLVFADPYLALKLLRVAEARRSRRLCRDTTTPLASVLQTGFDEIARLVKASTISHPQHQGHADCQHRAVLAASIAKSWASSRADCLPDEIAMAALLSECGELLLWHFAPELPQRAHDELLSGRALRSVQAQQQACGFSFKALTTVLVEAWQLPPLILLLIKGSDTLRANLARLATDVARHIVTSPENPAIPDDIVAVKSLLPGVTIRQLLAALPITDEFKESVHEQILDMPQQECAA